MNINESAIRKIVREMLLEAEAKKVTASEFSRLTNMKTNVYPADVISLSGRDAYKYNPVFDPAATEKDIGSRINNPQVAAARQRIERQEPKIKKMLMNPAMGKRIVTERNATSEETLLISMYLGWYALSKGVQDNKPWTELFPGLSWPTDSLYQFQVEQGLKGDGQLGVQTANYILSGGKRRTAPKGGTLPTTDVMMHLADQFKEFDPSAASIMSRASSTSYTDPQAPSPMKRKTQTMFSSDDPAAPLYTAQQQAMLGSKKKTQPKPARPDIVNTTSLPKNIATSIDLLSEDILDMFDEAVQEGSDETMMFSRSEIASIRKSLAAFIDSDAEKISMSIEKLPRGIDNAISRYLAARNIPTEIINMSGLKPALINLVNLHAGAA